MQLFKEVQSDFYCNNYRRDYISVMYTDKRKKYQN